MRIIVAIWFAAVLCAATRSAEEDAFWGTDDVAAYLGVPPATVRYWAWQGTGPRSYKIGRRRKYRPSEVRAWAEAQAEQPATPPRSGSSAASKIPAATRPGAWTQ
jgi:hypothetical protein